MWPLLSLTAFLEPEVRVEYWVRTSVPAHPKGCCCRVYKGTTSPQTPRTPQLLINITTFIIGRRGSSFSGSTRNSSNSCNSCFVGCLTSQQHASVSQGRICSDNLTCCHTEIEVADQTFHLTRSQHTDTDPITPGAWHGSHWSANF